MNLFACLDSQSLLLPLGTQDRQVTGICADSRRIEPGQIYVVLKGDKFDGRQFIVSAVARGAVAILGDEALARLASDEIPVIVTDDPRRSYARLVALFYPGIPAFTAAVTGTNGKTSVATFAMQLWQKTGHKAASLGTLGLLGDAGDKPGQLTTPDPIVLHSHLQSCRKQNVTHMIIEASSHGLDQRRLDGVNLSAAAFTNLSRDHFDYHGDVETYFQAKARLFTLLQDASPAIVNTDDSFGRRLVDDFRRLDLTTYGHGDGQDQKPPDLKIRTLEESADGLALDLQLWGTSYQCRVPVVGYFQAMNCLAALGLVVASGVDTARTVSALEDLTAPAGRMQRIGKGAVGGTVFVDYAHTPDALQTALEASRRLDTGRMIVVFGCGGDRDRGKRPKMGAVAGQWADHAIVTDDNPRSEDARTIREEIMTACPDAVAIGDRAEAIAHALTMMREHDCVLIAGKGHETGQVIGDVTHPFDDAKVARDVLQAMGPIG